MKKQGFTIVELIIAAAISVMVLGFIIPFMRDTQKMSAMANAKGTLRQEAQMALRALERDIAASRAKFEKLHADGTEKYKSTIDFPPTNTYIKLEVSKTDDSASVLLFESADDDDSNYELVTYTWSNGLLRRSHPTEGTLVVARHIKSIENKQGDKIEFDGKVTIEITTEMEVSGQTEKATHVELLTVAVRQLANKFLEGTPEAFDSRSNKRWRQKFTDGN
jgi:type II secretory pathway component PulJ